MSSTVLRDFFGLAFGVCLGSLLGTFLLEQAVSPPVYELNSSDIAFYPNHSEPGDTTVAEFFASKVQIFCLVLTEQFRHQTFVLGSKETWIDKCQGNILVSNVEDANVSSLNGGPDYQSRLAHGISYVIQKRPDFDWLLVGHDNTFVIMENLRHFLYQQSPMKAALFGERSQADASYPFTLNLEAGAVLSTAALEKFSQLSREEKCWKSGRTVGESLQNCMTAVEAPLHMCRDHEGKHRFGIVDPMNFWTGVENETPRIQELSETLISFPVYSEAQFVIYEKIIYHWMVFGGTGLLRQ